ncbi:MAG: outer membrane protein assembly factor BamC, partial [Acidobacteria bacterium]|nr:outer membrane protein assembly factor BamC [Acidobacteriota bacterium]NIQ29474.1 outer membrane protein assembly factor BamC [Acidobacteriota bacterium]NIQ84133.1 outer membrane protein assembly factor BamC [Acidobacteriota bacterium]
MGLDRDQADRQVARARLFAPRSTIQVDDENSPFLLLRDPYQIGWNRVYHELERLNFPIVEAEFKSGILGKGFITF